MGKRIDLTNQTFGSLKVSKEAGRTKRGETIWECMCDCGAVTLVPTGHLRSGHTKSCGCGRGKNVTHGMSYTKLYQIHTRIKGRCLNPNHPGYKRYGAVGVTLCEDWMKFEDFRNWALNNGYKEGLILSRLDYAGGYDPTNCRWVSLTDQPNQPNAYWIELDGMGRTLSDWARMLGVSLTTMKRTFETLSIDLVKAAEVFKGLESVRPTSDNEVTTPNNEEQ